MSEVTPPRQASKDEQFIGQYGQAPKFLRKNIFINKGYRINFNTPKKIFRSLFMLHNETINIWIHLIGAFIVIFVLGFFLWSNVSDTSKQNFKIQLQNKFDTYRDKLNLIGLTDKTNAKLAEITQTLKLKYEEFANMTSLGMQAANQSITKILAEMEKLFDESLIKFIEAKENFENKGAEDVMNALDHLGDNQTFIHQFKRRIKDLSEQIISKIDSPFYDFLDLTESPNPAHISRWPVVAMMISAIICLLCSAIFHLFYPMSGKHYTVFSRLDYAGINILISGSIIPGLYYGLYCRPALAKFYIVCVCIIAVTLFAVSLCEFMHTAQFRTFKSVCYGSFGIIVSIPLFHMIINEVFFHDGDEFTFIHSFPLYIALGASYLGGLVIYTKKCPQRNRPGHYDICGHSHQIWHVAVMMGIFFTYLAALQNFDERKRFPICSI